ncbi:MAG: hypothetical protein M1831_004592 [Alyxoria varia]|nr:MAG: hypothetical protein M1831_004592 [Alyxoria varia]
MVSADTFGNLSLQDEFLSEVMRFDDVNEKKCQDFTRTDPNAAAPGVHPTAAYLSIESTVPALCGTGVIGAEAINIPTSSYPLTSYHNLAQSSATSFGASSTDGSGSEISSPTQDDIFSPSSSISSSSSVSDSSFSRQGGQDSFAANYANFQSHSRLRTRDRRHIDHNNATTDATGSRVGSKDAWQKNHPRRTAVSASWAQPRLMRQESRRHQLVENLVDSATHLVSLIWPESGSKESFQGKIMSLRHFIRETLRRSRTSYSTLQVTLWYLILLRPSVRELCRNLDTDLDQTRQPVHTGNGLSNFRAVRCGRRMFLAALILASKFLQDRNYTARAWSKITGLRTQEIVENEFNFLSAIGWKLHLKEQDFAPWNHIILRCTESTWLGENIRITWSRILTMLEDGLTLHRICSFLDLRMSCPLPAIDGHASPHLEDARSDDCFKVPPRPTCAAGSQLELSDEKVEKEPYIPDPNIRPGPPAQPSLGGKLATPQLTPQSASSNLSTPAAGAAAPACSFGPQLMNNSSDNDDTYLKRAWENALSEFPMDLVKTPESISSEDRIRPGTCQLATRNRAFGLITPSSSFGSATSGRDDTSPNEAVPWQSAQACMVGQGMWACEPSHDSRIARNISNEFRQASNWIDMLAQAAETVNSRNDTEEERPIPKATRQCGPNGWKVLPISAYDKLGPRREPSISERYINMNGLQHCERAESAQPFAEASSKHNGRSGRPNIGGVQSQPAYGIVSSRFGNEDELLPMHHKYRESPERLAASKGHPNQAVGLPDRKRSSPDSLCGLPNAKVRCCGPSSCL